MIAGVGIFGVVAASAAAWFIAADQEQDRRQQNDHVATLTAEIAALRQITSELSARLSVQPQRPAGHGMGHHPHEAAEAPTIGTCTV